MTVGDPETRHDFEVVGSETVHIGRVMALRVDQVRMPGGRVAVREVVEHRGAVAIAAVDDHERVVLIHQYRHAVEDRLWELPAGLLDAVDEAPLEAARRELLEEVGLKAEVWRTLVEVAASPGFTDEVVRVFLAQDLAEAGRPDLGEDDEEVDLEIHRLPLAEAVEWVLAGKIVNGASVAGILAAHTVLSEGRTPRAADHPWPNRPHRFAERERAANA